jgi:hypothetical protein
MARARIAVEVGIGRVVAVEATDDRVDVARVVKLPEYGEPIADALASAGLGAEDVHVVAWDVGRASELLRPPRPVTTVPAALVAAAGALVTDLAAAPALIVHFGLSGLAVAAVAEGRPVLERQRPPAVAADPVEWVAVEIGLAVGEMVRRGWPVDRVLFATRVAAMERLFCGSGELARRIGLPVVNVNELLRPRLPAGTEEATGLAAGGFLPAFGATRGHPQPIVETPGPALESTSDAIEPPSGAIAPSSPPIGAPTHDVESGSGMVRASSAAVELPSRAPEPPPPQPRMPAEEPPEWPTEPPEPAPSPRKPDAAPREWPAEPPEPARPVRRMPVEAPREWPAEPASPALTDVPSPRRAAARRRGWREVLPVALAVAGGLAFSAGLGITYWGVLREVRRLEAELEQARLERREQDAREAAALEGERRRAAERARLVLESPVPDTTLAAVLGELSRLGPDRLRLERLAFHRAADETALTVSAVVFAATAAEAEREVRRLVAGLRDSAAAYNMTFDVRPAGAAARPGRGPAEAAAPAALRVEINCRLPELRR